MRYDEDGGLILINVIDLTGPGFAAEAGIMRPAEGDRIFIYNSNFSKNKKSRKAAELLLSWPLYVKNEELRQPMEEFFKSAFSPDHVLELYKTGNLSTVFIPLQQKFKIGRFQEKTDWDSLRKSRFRRILDGLMPGEHITYIAMIPQTSSYNPKFYSIGTKPHEETHISLKCEGFNFKPTHGGHIKAVKSKSGIYYCVDAGSSYIGKGVKTKIETAESITAALNRKFRDLSFSPLAGRGAFGTEQSY